MNDLYNLYLLFPSLAHGIIMIRQGLVNSVWLIGISGHGARSLIFQWVSTIKFPWVCNVTNQNPSWYDGRCGKDIKFQQPIMIMYYTCFPLYYVNAGVTLSWNLPQMDTRLSRPHTLPKFRSDRKNIVEHCKNTRAFMSACKPSYEPDCVSHASASTLGDIAKSLACQQISKGVSNIRLSIRDQLQDSVTQAY